jgi:hypothetical protein
MKVNNKKGSLVETLPIVPALLVLDEYGASLPALRIAKHTHIVQAKPLSAPFDYLTILIGGG